LRKRRDSDHLDRLCASKADPSALIPPTIADWSNEPPPTEWRLPIDEELRGLACRKHSPIVRSNSVILAEFPTLDWDGPYRAMRYFLWHFSAFTFINILPLQTKLLNESKTQVHLLRDIQKLIHSYVTKMEQSYTKTTLSERTGWLKHLELLRSGIDSAEVLEQVAQDIIKQYKKTGRPPKLWKSSFISGLGKIWRIMTGDDASKDLFSPFASFADAAWISLGDDLPEISWASQIRRRKDTSSTSELVSWANRTRRLPASLYFRRNRADPDKT
jgi:hypothetical protein